MRKKSIVKYITKIANHCFCCFIFTRFDNYNFTKKNNNFIITGIRYPSYSDYDYDIGPPYGQIGPSRLGPAQLDPPKVPFIYYVITFRGGGEGGQLLSKIIKKLSIIVKRLSKNCQK